MPNRGGRPTKFTPHLGAEVIKALNAGMLLQDAAEFAGIHRDTLHTWLTKGAKRRNPLDALRAFSDEVRRARMSAKLRAVAYVHGAMKENWKAAAWWLQVTDPKHYGPKIRVTLEQEFTDALARISKRLPAEVYEQVLDAILEDSGGAGESPTSEGEELEH
jgi:hypothetical protein